MKYGLVVRAFTTPIQVRQFCINHDFYTRGTNEEYDDLFDYVKKHPRMDEIPLSVVVGDIIKHSDIDLDVWLGIVDDMVWDIKSWFLTEACTILYDRDKTKTIGL